MTAPTTPPGEPPTVLFLCVHNAGRSQMAAALLARRAGASVAVRSAGSEPSPRLHPVVLEAMAEIGIDLSSEAPKRLTLEMATEADVVVSMGCGDACPVFPGKRYLDWILEDPSGRSLGDVRTIRDQIDALVAELLDDLLPAPPERSYVSSRLAAFGTTIFAEMSALALETGAVNLGQGFPEDNGPLLLRSEAIAAIEEGDNQYPPGIGLPVLLEAIADHQRAEYGLSYDPRSEILVTTGATEAIAACLLGLCEPGDEVVVFEPYYDSYAAAISMAGATRVVVPLRPADSSGAGDGGWAFSPAFLRGAVTDRTRVLLLNSPHNPTGKVFDPDELAQIASLCREHDLVAVTDEVYEHLVFHGRHVPLASLPGMRERTITISSAGKTFSVTGWKVGWACAPRPLLDAVRAAKQFLTYVSGAPFQRGVAAGLAVLDEIVGPLVADLKAHRDLLAAGLTEAGFSVYVPDATYFLTADITRLTDEDAVSFCRALPARCGVVAIPCSVFFDDKAASRSLVRFAFCKRRATIEEAVERIGRLTS